MTGGRKTRRLRLDELLVARGICRSVDEARRHIWAGEVIVDEHLADQPAAPLPPEAVIRLRLRHGRYASRGGEKLEAALQAFALAVEGRVALDIGASRGGFSDCLLAHGAARVYAVELGRGLLAQRLRLDPRVVDMSGRDVMGLRPEELDPRPDLATMDVTFRSLADLLPKVRELLAGEQEMVALLKPLFEARLAGLGRVGEVQRRVFEDLLPRLQARGIPLHGVIASPAPGAGGAIEFLLHLRAPGLGNEAIGQQVEAALQEGKELLTKRPRPARSGLQRRRRWRRFAAGQGEGRPAR